MLNQTSIPGKTHYHEVLLQVHWICCPHISLNMWDPATCRGLSASTLAIETGL